MPGWRNWQTRRTQNPVLAREWEFDPPSGHHLQPVILKSNRRVRWSVRFGRTRRQFFRVRPNIMDKSVEYLLT